jgi:HSP20 family molecular chaperone IbpA
MAFFPIHRYRVFDDPFDRLFGGQLDFFDPWRDFDTFPTALTIRPNSFRWVNQPQQSTHSHTNTEPKSSAPPHSEKFRVQLNVAGFNPATIKTRVEGRKIIVEAKQEDRQPDGDYQIREIRKSYELPQHADANRLASYVTPNNLLVIEAPIQNPENERRVEQAKKDNQNLAQFGQHRDPLFDYSGFLGGSDSEPRIVDKGNNQKQLEMTFGMKNYRPEEIKVSVKNNQLVVQGEHRQKDENYSGRSFFFKSTTLPPGTQIEQLQTHLTDDGQLKIEAPFIEQKETPKSVEGQNKDGQNKNGQNKDAQNKDGQHKDGQNKDAQNKDGQNKDNQK